MAERKIVRFDTIGSTSTKALELGMAGEPAGTVVTAETQTVGRGRLHRSWLSPPGTGLYFSVILMPQLDPADLPKITLAAGVAACVAIELELGLAPQIKWPNDLLFGGKKFAGILAEAGALHGPATGELPLIVVGIGINIEEPDGGFPDELQATATSLAEHTDAVVVRDDLMVRIADELDRTVARLEKGEFGTVLEQWKQRDTTRDKELTWVTPRGEKVTGISLGPDEDGLLRIRDREGRVHEVLSGDLSITGKG